MDLKDIRVSYDGKQDILKDLNISMEKGELVSLRNFSPKATFSAIVK